MLSQSKSIESKIDSAASLIYQPVFSFCLLLGLVLFSLINNVEVDRDLFARIAVGKLFSENGISSSDPFAYTNKKEIWIDHEWLSGVIFYQVAQLAGDSGLLAFKFLLVTATLFFLYRASILATSRFLALPLCLIAAVQSRYIWASTVRSQIFTYLFLAYLLWALLKMIKFRSPLALYPMPIIMMFWIQCHGGFVVALGLLGIFCAWWLLYGNGHKATIALIGLITLIASGVSPYGPLVYWEYILSAVGMDRPSIPEWGPLPLTEVFGIAVHLICLLLLCGFVLKKQKDSLDILFVSFIVVSAYFAYSHQRLVAIFCFVAATFGSSYLEIVLHKLTAFVPHYQKALVNSLALALLMVGFFCTAIFCLKAKQFSNLDYSDYPINAFDWLKKNSVTGNLLVDFNNGSFAIWAGYPEIKVSLDGRYEELYHDSLLKEVTIALTAGHPEQYKYLSRINPDLILVDCKGITDCNPQIANDWQILFQDQRFSILGKEAVKSPLPAASSDVIISNMWSNPNRWQIEG